MMLSFFDFSAPFLSLADLTGIQNTMSGSSGWLCLGFLSGFGYTEMILFGVIALMLFGSKLPEVARNFGATYRQLRGKVDEFQREFREWDRMDSPPRRQQLHTDDDDVRSEPKSPKFIPPPPEAEDSSESNVSSKDA